MESQGNLFLNQKLGTKAKKTKNQLLEDIEKEKDEEIEADRQLQDWKDNRGN